MDKNKKTSYLVTFVLVLVSFAIIQILILSGIIDSYWQSILFLLCINIILSISLNIIVGNLGQITLGHAGFMSIGAYSAGIFLKTGIIEGIPGFFIALLIGGLFAFLFSLAIGIPVLRLNGDYLAIVTLAFGEIIRVVVENLSITGGAQGMAGIPTVDSFALVFFVTVLCVVFMLPVKFSIY